MKKKIYILVTLLSLAFSLFGINPACAANADVSGFWQINLSAPDMTVYTEQIDVYPDGHQERSSFTDENPILSVLLLPQITQSADGTLSGFMEVHTPYSTVTETIAGSVAANAVNLRLIFNSTTNQSGVCDVTMTFTYDFSGTISGNTMSGAFEVSENSNGTYYETKYTSYLTSYGSTSGTFTAQSAGIVLDTIITSGPDSPTNSKTATFTYFGTSSNGIAGYYYQFDSNSKVYTTKTSVAFTNLSYGDHIFSVAARDKKGNIDSTPAVWNFKIEPVPSPDPNEKSQNGPSTDSRKTPGDPSNIATGNMHVLTSDIAFPGKGISFDFTRTYNSREDYSGPLGFGWTHSYNIFLTPDPVNKLIKIRDGEGKEILFADDENGGYVPQRGEYSNLTKDKTGFIWKKKNGTKLYFNTLGKLTKITDRNSNAITLTYNKLNQLAKITDTSGRAINFTYDSQNRITSVSIPISKSVSRTYTYAYDSNNNLIKATDPKGGTINYEYNSSHNLTKKIDPNGNPGYFTYDSSDRCTSSSRDNNYERVSLSFDPVSGRTTLTDSKGNITRYYYNSDWQLTKIIDAQNNQTESTWDENLNRTSFTNELGLRTEFEYDNNGNITRLRDAQGNITSFTYEPTFNNITSRTDALGQITTYYYDKKGNLTKVIDPQGVPTYYLYNTSGFVTNIVNAYKKRIYLTYDKYGNLASVKDPAGVTIKFAYDILGNKIKSYGTKGELTQYFYNELNQLIKVIHPNSTKALTLFSTFTYDPYGRRTSATDALGNTTTYTYDAAGKMESVTDALGGRITYAYDSEGNLTSIKDQKNNETKFAYDSLNRLITKTDAANYKWQYFYDAAGNRTKEIDPKGQAINYYYDELNRLTRLAGPDVSASFAYDALGRRTSMTDWQGTTYYAYDPASRLLSVDGPVANDAIQYTYDLVGNRISMLDPDGKLTQYSYDAANRLTKITDPGGQLTKFYYDKYGNPSSVYYPNKTLVIYLYDNYNRLYKLINRLSVKPYTQLSEYAYTYDQLNRKIKMTTLDATYEYGYDTLSQLTQEKRASSTSPYQISYTYDAAGNRLAKTQDGTTTSYLYNALNQLTRETTGASYINYYYDNNGNLIRALQNSGAVKNFTYDSLNRLLYVYSPAAPYIDEGYKYDGEGRRVEVTAANPTRYLYDGLNTIIERNVIGNTLASYLRNPFAPGGIGGIISQQSTVNSPQYYHYDGLGSVTNLTNSAGSAQQYYSYDAFGNIISQTGSLNDAHKFLTKETDSSGLIYFGARYYDPRIGRFITQDPLGMIDGPNLYAYVYNNPLNLVDPFGLYNISYNAGVHIPASAGTAVGFNLGSELSNPLSSSGRLEAKGISYEMVLGEIFDVGASAGISDISGTGGIMAGMILALNLPWMGKYGGIQLTLRKDFNWSNPSTWIPDAVQVGLGVGISLPVTITGTLEKEKTKEGKNKK